jgi:hypothetical protein
MIEVKKECELLSMTDWEFENEDVIYPAAMRESICFFLFNEAIWEGNYSNTCYCRLDVLLTFTEKWDKLFAERWPVYSTCTALMDINNPLKIIAQLPYPLFLPEFRWELKVEVNNVVFSTGAALFGDTLFIYYGAADSHIACASVSLSTLITELITYTNQNEK